MLIVRSPLRDVSDSMRYSPEAGTATVEPETHNVIHSFAHLLVLPVEIGLLLCEKAQEVLLRRFIPAPRRT